MIKFCVQQWDKNSKVLKEDIIKNLSFYNEASYKDLMVKVVELVFNDEESQYNGEEWDYKNITEVDNGSYQGTLLYLIPKQSYQPDESEYLMTYVGYGSCSGCDTLQAIQMWDMEDVTEEEVEKFISNIMTLCLHMIQHTIKPYDSGWGDDDLYKTVG